MDWEITLKPLQILIIFIIFAVGFISGGGLKKNK